MAERATASLVRRHQFILNGRIDRTRDPLYSSVHNRPGERLRCNRRKQTLDSLDRRSEEPKRGESRLCSHDCNSLFPLVFIDSRALYPGRYCHVITLALQTSEAMAERATARPVFTGRASGDYQSDVRTYVRLSFSIGHT